ncbi:MAG: hypothetical protein U9R73_00540 [Pseudomonadota bacterium]|nr:hypothetical protein [Pseudomonadota bacterium]
MDFIAFQNAVQLNGGIIPEHLKDVARKFRGEQDAAVMGAEAAVATASDQIIDALDAEPEIVRAILADNGIETAEDASEETLRDLLAAHGDLPELAGIIAEAIADVDADVDATTIVVEPEPEPEPDAAGADADTGADADAAGSPDQTAADEPAKGEVAAAEDASEETVAPDFDAMNRADLVAFASVNELEEVNTRSNVREDTIREQVRKAWAAKQAKLAETANG